MREIKFRAWYRGKMREVQELDYYSGKLRVGMDGIENMQKPILMQFSGLTDRKGKEIYESDIIKIDNDVWLVEPIGSLERDGDNYGLCVSKNGDGENYFLDKSILAGEVIGNIYSDPHLLEQNK